jgi:hypothetical protein
MCFFLEKEHSIIFIFGLDLLEYDRHKKPYHLQIHKICAGGITNAMTYEVSWKDQKGKIVLEVYTDIYKAIDRTSVLQLLGLECFMVYVPDLTKVKPDPIQILIENYEKERFICDFYEVK